MEKITSKGKIDGRKRTVECMRAKDMWAVLVDGEKNERIETRLMELEAEKRPFAGSYAPEDETSAYYMLSALVSLFDRYPSFEMEGIEPMESEKDVVY